MKFLAACARRLNERAAAAELYALEDYQLKDIGISRSEIEGKVQRGRNSR